MVPPSRPPVGHLHWEPRCALVMSNPAAPSVMVNCRLRSGQDRQAVAWEAAAYLLMFCGASMCRHTLRHRSPPANARHSLPRPQAAGALRAWACRARTSPWSAPAAAGRCRGPDPAGPRARHGGYSLSFRVISLRQPESSASCSSRGLNTERDDLLPRPSAGRHPGPRPTGAVRPSARRSSPAVVPSAGGCGESGLPAMPGAAVARARSSAPARRARPVARMLPPEARRTTASGRQ